MSPKRTLSRITGGVGGYREDAKAEGLQRQGNAPLLTTQTSVFGIWRPFCLRPSRDGIESNVRKLGGA